MRMPQKSKPAGPAREGRDRAVCDGRDCVGFVRQFPDCWVAYDNGGKYLGRFANQRAAIRAIPARARRTTP
jgi:hypothetical protein